VEGKLQDVLGRRRVQKFIDSLENHVIVCGFGRIGSVVVEELIPESQQHGNTDIATLGTMIGFVVMMVLDVALG